MKSSEHLSKFARALETFLENVNKVGYRMRINRNIQKYQERINQIESILPITKHSVRRKELLRKKKSLEGMIKNLQDEYEQSS